tara:strand:+ start:226 stop:918 length:693 start_codon:yes stop_codon:yes gene_type:complete
MQITALLTGRGGSSLKDKNVIKILKKPVLAYPCEESKKVKKIDNYFVSSDDEKILNTAFSYGFQKIKRPKHLSKANSKHYDVLKHSLKELRKRDLNPDILVVLLANAPIVYSKWIDESINLIIKKKATAVVPVVLDNDKHPLRSKKIVKKYLNPFIKTKKKVSSNRQDLENCYFLCHNFWVIRTDAIIQNNGLNPWNFMGSKVLPYLVPHSHDIHTEFDLKICKLLLQKK